jgi:subtilisin family serine protease
MKLFILKICLFCIFFITSTAYGKEKIQIQINDKQNLPTVEKNGSYVKLTFQNNAKVQAIFDQFKITKFERQFPSADRTIDKSLEWLKLVYFIETEELSKMYNALSLHKGDFFKEVAIYVEPTLFSTPDDFALYQGNYFGQIVNSGSFLDNIRAKEAWEITEGNPKVVIGIVDLGFDVLHVDLANKVLNPNNVPPYPLPPNDEFTYHGTQTAGVAACETNNGIGFSSIGNKCMLKVYEGIDYDNILLAAIEGCKVINCSWGTCNNYSSIGQEFINDIYNVYKTVIVAAAGNGKDGAPCYNVNGYSYPASYDHVISVSGSNHLLTPSPNLPIPWYDYFLKDRFEYNRGHANTNPPQQHNDKVTLTAPGYTISILNKNNGYLPNSGGGTSFASPIVSGTIGLILSVNPDLTHNDVKAILQCSSKDIYEIYDNINYLNKIGTGRLDARKALELAETWIPGSAPTAINPPPTDIKWYEIRTNSNGSTTETLVDCVNPNAPVGSSNVGYRLEVVAPNMNATFKWLCFYKEDSQDPIENVKYGTSITILRGLDYADNMQPSSKIKICVRTNECVPSIYYAEDRTVPCMGIASETCLTAPTDIRWFEITRDNGFGDLVEHEVTCRTNDPSICHIGYRLQAVTQNPNQSLKWKIQYLAGNTVVTTSEQYGHSIYIYKGIDYPYTTNSVSKIVASVKSNECLANAYYSETRLGACIGSPACSNSCLSNITITGTSGTDFYAPVVSSTWIKSAGQTIVAGYTYTELQAQPVTGYVLLNPISSTDMFLAAPNIDGYVELNTTSFCGQGVTSIVEAPIVNKITRPPNKVYDKVIAYPNPTSGIFNVQGVSNLKSLQVYNIQGEQILSKVINGQAKLNNSVAIDLSMYPSGIYIVRSERQTFSIKIVKL